jgi:hypothetical protein
MFNLPYMLVRLFQLRQRGPDDDVRHTRTAALYKHNSKEHCALTRCLGIESLPPFRWNPGSMVHTHGIILFLIQLIYF